MILKASIPEEDPIFVQAFTWFEARGIGRQLCQPDEHEAAWREMQKVEVADLLRGSTVYWRDPQTKEICCGVVRKAGTLPLLSRPANSGLRKKRKQARTSRRKTRK